MNFKTTLARRNEMLDSLKDDYDNGYLRIYSGAQPADADTALSGNTLLAELRFNATAFPSASAATLTANAIAADTTADATGTATFFRALKSDGSTVISDGDAGTGAQNLVLNTASIVAGARVEVLSFTISLT